MCLPRVAHILPKNPGSDNFSFRMRLSDLVAIVGRKLQTFRAVIEIAPRDLRELRRLGFPDDARQRQTTPDFKAAYAARSGIEGSLSQGIRVCELSQARYRGQTKTRLQNALIATALNLLRVIAWLMEVPREQSRQSAFARLAPGPATSAFAGWG
jgi:hypothetical protein